jgi:hypothetical protein
MKLVALSALAIRANKPNKREATKLNRKALLKGIDKLIKEHHDTGPVTIYASKTDDR